MAGPDSLDQALRAALATTYDLDRELAGGGMSRVFLATERALNRKVVIKVLPPELAAGVNRERFQREVQLAAQLQHPHICPLYAAGAQGELLWYTMPFIEGESLKAAVQSGARFSPREVVGVLHDVVDALAYAHGRGVIHRDIKPGNVLRSGRHAVVTDFGVAKAISAAMPKVGTTTSGMAIGTPAYMAPEQLAGDPAADHRMDLYAVGLLAYELLTGEVPFSESSPAATMAAQLTRNPAPIGKVRTDVPPELSALVMRCLQKNPADRPATAAALLAELDAIMSTSGDYPPLGRRRRPVPLALAGGGLLVLLVALLIRDGVSPGAAEVRNDSIAANPPAPAPAPPPALTREDSLAIARAVQKKMAERKAATPAPARIDSAELARIAAQLRSEVERAVLDSLSKLRPPMPPPGSARQLLVGPDGRRREGLVPGVVVDSILRAAQRFADSAARAQRGRGPDVQLFVDPLRRLSTKEAMAERAANMGPPRQFVVWDHPPERQRPDVQAAGTAIMDVLRKSLAGTPHIMLVPRDPTFAVLAQTRNRDSVLAMLSADMMASIRGSVSRGDSVMWVITVRDPTSRVTQRTVTTPWAPLATPMAYADSLVRATLAAVQEMDRTPRRPQPPPRP